MYCIGIRNIHLIWEMTKNWILNWNSVNPLNHGAGGGGGGTNTVQPPPCGFLPLNQNIFRRPMPEKVLTFPCVYPPNSTLEPPSRHFWIVILISFLWVLLLLVGVLHKFVVGEVAILQVLESQSIGILQVQKAKV